VSHPTSRGGSMVWARRLGRSLQKQLGSETSCWISPRTCTCRASTCHEPVVEYHEIVRLPGGPIRMWTALAVGDPRNLGRVEVVHAVARPGRSGLHTGGSWVATWGTMFVSFSVMALRVSPCWGLC